MEFEQISIRKLFFIKNWYDLILIWNNGKMIFILIDYISRLIFGIFGDMIRNVNSEMKID